MNVDGFAAMSHQNLLSFGFLLGVSYPHPDQQALRFRKPIRSKCALPPQPPTRPEYRCDACDKPAQDRKEMTFVSASPVSDSYRLPLLKNSVRSRH